MTNELAIRILTGDVLGTSEQTQEAVTMAVKALSQSYVPDTNVGDKISRQAAIDALWKALFKYEDDAEKQFQESDELDVSEWILHRIFVQNMSDIDRQTILNLPSAQPDCSDCIKHGGDWDCDHVHCHIGRLPSAQPKAGHWIEHEWAEETNGMLISNYECSECHRWERYNSDFCPNCGAKMEE